MKQSSWRHVLRRISPVIALLVTGGLSILVIFVAISVVFVLNDRNALTLLIISGIAATAIIGLRVALDVVLHLLIGTPPSPPVIAAPAAPKSEPVLDQSIRMDELMRLNNQLARVNKDLEQAKEQIERLDLVKTDFITIASHELRTPLAQMRGYTDIIDALNDSGVLDPERLSGLAGNLRKATERMEELIGAMLDTSQIDVNAMDLRYTPATIETVVRMAIDPLTDAIRERKIMLRASGLGGLPSLQGDMQRLVQAFRNVIVNAVKFTPDGGRIDIMGSLMADTTPKSGDNADNSGQCIHVIIRDTGVGIADENLELIFHKFYRAYDPVRHSTGAYKFMGAGPGLGLTIARGIIAGHGGRIWAESPGNDMNTMPGSSFHIIVPINPPIDARRILPFGSDSDADNQKAPPLIQSSL